MREKAKNAALNSAVALVTQIVVGSENSQPLFVRGHRRSVDIRIFACMQPRTADGESLVGWLNRNFPAQQSKGWPSSWNLVVVVCQFLHVHCGMEGLADYDVVHEIYSYLMQAVQKGPAWFPLPCGREGEGRRRSRLDGQYECIPLLVSTGPFTKPRAAA